MTKYLFGTTLFNFQYLLSGTCVGIDTADAWYVEPCECTTGWTGDLCDEDIDGCAEGPCFTLCTDVKASKVMSGKTDSFSKDSIKKIKYILIY